MTLRAVQLLITDLDNTLYDWVTCYVRSFYAMVDVALPILGVPREELLDDLRDVFRRYRSAETPFVLLDTHAANTRFSGFSRADMVKELDKAFHRFNSVRKETLCLFPNVRTTLEHVRSCGVPIVAHTEGAVPTALFRLHQLEIAQYFSHIYALEHEGTSDSRKDAVSERNPRVPFWSTPAPQASVRLLARDKRKPNPAVLASICADLGVDTHSALYVGDSLIRDIEMAKAAGAWAAWAQYGTRYEQADWERLVRLTHWSIEDVARHQEFLSGHSYRQPDVTLADGFAEVLEHFVFRVPGESSKATT